LHRRRLASRHQAFELLRDLDGTVKIGDYGLSISIESRGRISQGHGATAFHGTSVLRPSTSAAKSTCARHLLLAATLYFLITGAPPFDEPNSSPSSRRSRLSAILAERNPQHSTSRAASSHRSLLEEAADRPASYEELMAL
jgi:hypothetical protein